VTEQSINIWPALRSTTMVIGLTCAISGCSQSTGLPAAPSQSTATSALPKAAPHVTDIVPSVGSAGGGATLKLVGTGFMPGMVVAFDGIKVTGRFDSRDTSFTTFYTETPAHSTSVVDLVVTNPDGQSEQRPGAYTYAPQESFDLNGVWSGFSLNGTDTAVAFVIESNRLVSASCAYDVLMPFPFSEVPSVRDGEFSAIADGGATMSGRIVSASEILGTISFSPCTKTPLPWRVNRRN
jgi:IPT/TIG domain